MVKNKIEGLMLEMFKINDKAERRKLLRKITHKEYMENINFAICPDCLLMHGYECKEDNCYNCKIEFYEKHKNLFRKEKEGNTIW